MTSAKSQNSPLNFTDVVNHTEGIDIFCTKLYVGPLVFSVLTLPCSLVGVVASVWLLWVLIRRQCTNFLCSDIYMLNLTVMNLLYDLCISVLPYTLNFYFCQNYIFFKTSDVFYGLNMYVQPLFVACICVDCYMAVVYPVVYMKLKLSNHRLVICLSVWVLSLSFEIMFVFNNQLVSSVTVIPYIFSLPIIVFCNLSILHALRKPDPSGRSDVHPQKRRALQAITNSFILAVVSYLPPLVAFAFLPLIPLSSQEIFCHVSIPIAIPPVLGSAIMPLLHLENLGILKLKKSGCARGSNKN